MFSCLLLQISEVRIKPYCQFSWLSMLNFGLGHFTGEFRFGSAEAFSAIGEGGIKGDCPRRSFGSRTSSIR